MIKSISKGDRPDKSFILDRLRSLKNITGKNGKTDIKEAIQLKQDWNKYLSDPSLPKSSRDTLQQAVKTVNEGIKRYGSTNPEFFKPYHIGEELTGALQSTNFIQKVLAKNPNLQQSVKNPIIKHLLWGGVGYGLSHVASPTIIGGVSAGIGLKETAKAYQLLTRSPIARKYYKDTINSILKNDSKAIARNLSKLDKVADSFDNKHPEIKKDEQNKSRYRLLD